MIQETIALLSIRQAIVVGIHVIRICGLVVFVQVRNAVTIRVRQSRIRDDMFTIYLVPGYLCPIVHSVTVAVRILWVCAASSRWSGVTVVWNLVISEVDLIGIPNPIAVSIGVHRVGKIGV